MSDPVVSGVPLIRGAFYRIQWRFPNASDGGSFFGEYKYVSQGAPVFWQPARGRFTRLTYGKVITCADEVTAADMMALVDLYQKVRIHKYGSTYTGSVVGKGRTRLCIAFRTRGGKDKEQWIPALEVEPVN